MLLRVCKLIRGNHTRNLYVLTGHDEDIEFEVTPDGDVS